MPFFELGITRKQTSKAIVQINKITTV